MNNTTNRIRQAPGILTVLLIFTMLVLPSPQVGATQQAQKTSAPLDLPAMTLTPEDLELAGLPRYGLASVNGASPGWRTIGDAAFDSVAGNLLGGLASLDHVSYELAQTGWERQYRRVLALPYAEDPSQSDAEVFSEVAEYADEEGADAALTILTSGGQTESTAGVKIGDRTEIRRDILLDSGARIVVAFRVGNLIGTVTHVMFGSMDDQPLDPVIALAEQLQKKMEAGVAAPGPGLDRFAVRLATLASPAEYEGYWQIAGEIFPDYNESAEQLAERASWLGEATDTYQFQHRLPPTNPGQQAFPLYTSRLYQFEDTAAAARFMDELPSKIAGDAIDSDGNFKATLYEDAIQYGDESLEYEIQDVRSDGPTFGHRIYTRVGNRVARLQFDSSDSIPRAALESLATAQAACFSAGSCANAEQAPLKVAGWDCPPTSMSSSVLGVQNANTLPFDPVPMPGANPARTGVQPGPGPVDAPVDHTSIVMDALPVESLIVSGRLLAFSTMEEASWGRNGYLYAFDSTTANYGWCLATGETISDPVLHGNTIYAVAKALIGDHSHSFVVALDAVTGVEQWRAYIGEFTGPIANSVAVAGEAVYATNESGTLFAIDAATGVHRWAYHVPLLAEVADRALTAPTLDDGAVYFSGGRTVYAVDAATGEELWQHEADRERGLGTPTVADGWVYVPGTDYVHAINATNGQPAWRIPTYGEEESRIAIADGVLFVSSSVEPTGAVKGSFTALRAEDGVELWRVEIAGLQSSPTVVGEIVYLATGIIGEDAPTFGAVYAFNVEDGSLLWNLNVLGAPSTPVVTGGQVFVPSIDGMEGNLFGEVHVIGDVEPLPNETPILDRKSG